MVETCVCNVGSNWYKYHSHTCRVMEASVPHSKEYNNSASLHIAVEGTLYIPQSRLMEISVCPWRCTLSDKCKQTTNVIVLQPSGLGTSTLITKSVDITMITTVTFKPFNLHLVTLLYTLMKEETCLLVQSKIQWAPSSLLARRSFIQQHFVGKWQMQPNSIWAV